jgi:hypothetical protein
MSAGYVCEAIRNLHDSCGDLVIVSDCKWILKKITPEFVPSLTVRHEVLCRVDGTIHL